MLQLERTTVPHGPSENQGENRGTFEFAFSLRRREKGVMLKIPNGLVVSSDEEVRRSLADILVRCGLAPLFSSTVAGSGIVLSRRKVFVVLSHNFLVDGGYEDIMKAVRLSNTNVPVIVVSRMGDWPEYLTAIHMGAFDYLAYPPIPGELERIVKNAVKPLRTFASLE